MPTTSFIGKSIVENLHISTPYRSLRIAERKGVGSSVEGGNLVDQNLILHGDNLAGLKALLPTHAGKIDCIYGDPPYNTGNEGWRYNDNVNSPLLKHWFEETGVAGEFVGREVDRDDPERHDKWMAMMWPRLRLMHELLSDKGAIFLSIDDDEHHALRNMCDEIFGRKNFVASIVWQKKYAPQNDATWFSDMHEYVVVYAKNKDEWRPNGLPRKSESNKLYKNVDNDPRGLWRADNLSVKTVSENGLYEITTPSGRKVRPPEGRAWGVSRERFDELVADNRIWFGEKGDNVPAPKRFLSEVRQTRVPETFWHYEEVGHTDGARKDIKKIFPDSDRPFDTPKPLELVERVVLMATSPDSIVLDPFAGSGTTGHAVLARNKADGGSRRFVMLECEDYADELTAERMRRVITGVSGMKDPRFGQGFPGAGFVFAGLGAPIDATALLSDHAPSRADVARFVLHSASGTSASSIPEESETGFIGEVLGKRYHLIYRPDPEFLRSNASALTRDLAERIRQERCSSFLGETVVFAACCFVNQKELLAEFKIRFVSIPFDLVKI